MNEQMDSWGVVHRDIPAMRTLQGACPHENTYDRRFVTPEGMAHDMCACLDCGLMTAYPFMGPSGLAVGYWERYVLAPGIASDWQQVGQQRQPPDANQIRR
jgi:hypothetical protein